MTPRSNTWADADVRRAERAAIDAYNRLDLVHPTEPSIDVIAHMLGATVRDVHMTGAVGRLTRFGDRAVIAVSTRAALPGRRRWTIAHELGHLELHSDHNQLDLIEDVTLEEHYDQGIEREANAFAAEFLMPTHLWAKHVDVRRPDLDIVKALAADYQVSLQAAGIRFIKLCPERCALVFSREGRVKWMAVGPEFGHWIERERKLDSYSLAHDFFAKGRQPPRREMVSASAWFDDDGPGGDDEEIFEDCVVIPSLDATLSLLWIATAKDD